jgi:hypothetical protein
MIRKSLLSLTKSTQKRTLSMRRISILSITLGILPALVFTGTCGAQDGSDKTYKWVVLYDNDNFDPPHNHRVSRTKYDTREEAVEAADALRDRHNLSNIRIARRAVKPQRTFDLTGTIWVSSRGPSDAGYNRVTFYENNAVTYNSYGTNCYGTWSQDGNRIKFEYKVCIKDSTLRRYYGDSYMVYMDGVMDGNQITFRADDGTISETLTFSEGPNDR